MLFPDLSLEGIKASLSNLKTENIEQDNAQREKIKDFYEGRGGSHKYYEPFGFFDKRGNLLVPLADCNITKKIIDKISLVYKEQPEINLASDKKNDPYKQWLSENPTIHIAKKTAERYKNLLHVILFAPRFFNKEWTAFNQKQEIAEWRYYIEDDFIPHFHIDDPLHPIGYSIPIKKNPQDIQDNQDQRWMFWSDDYYFEHNNKGEIYAVDDTDFKNTFEVNPYIEMRKSYPVDIYDTGGVYDLVQSHWQVNIAIADLNLMIHHQAFDQPYAIGIDSKAAEKIELGPNKMIGISESGEGVTMGLLGYSPQIVDTVEAVKYLINTIAWTYNVSIDWSIEGSVASGVALKIKNMDLLEAREDDAEIAMGFEKSVYKAIQSQHIYYKKAKKITDKLTLPDENILVNFGEVDFPANIDEEIKRQEFDIKNNYTNPIREMMKRDKDLNEEEATKQYEENKKINQQLNRPGLFDLVEEGNIEGQTE